MVQLYVDDMIYMGLTEFIVAEFKACTVKEFEMSNLSLLHYFLGLEVKQIIDGISFHKEICNVSFEEVQYRELQSCCHTHECQ